MKGPNAAASPPSSAFGFLKGSTAKKPPISPKLAAAFDDSDEEEGDGDDDSVNELLNLRDSILIPSNKGDKDNRLADWSFIDAELLMGSMKKKKSANKWTPAASDVLEEDARLEESSIALDSTMITTTTTITTTFPITTTVTIGEGGDAHEKTDTITLLDAPKNLASSESLNSPDGNSAGIQDDTRPATAASSEH